MKIAYIQLSVFLWLSNGHLLAQKQLNEVRLKYNISVNTENQNAPSKVLNGASFSVYLKGANSRTEMINAIGSEITIYDNVKNNGAILREYSGQKLLIAVNGENWADKNKHFRQLKFSNEPTVQQINGYRCKKSVAQLDDGDEMLVFYSPDYILNNKNYNYGLQDINGLPVQFELTSHGTKFIYTLNEMSFESIITSKFDLPTSGNYRVLNYDDAKKIKSGN